MSLRGQGVLRFFLLGLVLSFVSMGLVWHFGVRWLVPASKRFGFPSVFHTWFYAPDSDAYLDQLGNWFLAVGYPYYFTLIVPFGVAVFGWVFARVEDAPGSVKHALIGSGVGAVIGFFDMILLPWLALVFGFCAPRVMLAGQNVWVLLGTVIRHHRPKGRGAVNRAVARGRTALAGIVLGREAEVRHIAAIGVTGSGKSTVLRGLMHTALARGDRHVVADADGSALRSFWRPGDAILNPFDARSVKWDMLAEIREETDYRFIGDAALPAPAKGAAHDEWVGYAREIFIACLRTWHKNGLGSSDAFLDAMATAGRDKLALLCEGTAAHHYFAEGNERMLGSIMGTMAPRLEIMRQAAAAQGARFSVRHWIREGRGGGPCGCPTKRTRSRRCANWCRAGWASPSPRCCRCRIPRPAASGSISTSLMPWGRSPASETRKPGCAGRAGASRSAFSRSISCKRSMARRLPTRSEVDPRNETAGAVF
jgi:hypothetical protein